MKHVAVVMFVLLTLCQHWRLSVCYRFADHIIPTDNNIDDEGGQDEGFVTHIADIPPPRPALRSCTATDGVFNHGFDDEWSFADSILQRYWSDGDGFITIRSDDDDNNQRQFTYGEVTSLGGSQLAYAMGISATTTATTTTATTTTNSDDIIQEECDIIIEGDNDDDDDGNCNQDVIFFDLGSGVGRLVVQMYLEQPYRIKKSIGIELSKDRHNIAVEALEKLITTESDDVFFQTQVSEHIEFIHGDALQSTDILHEATHVFMSSLCFPSSVLESLQHQLTRLPNIQVIAALNRLDILLEQNQNDDEDESSNSSSSSFWWEEREVPVQMNWGPGLAKVYYKKKTKK